VPNRSWALYYTPLAMHFVYSTTGSDSTDVNIGGFTPTTPGPWYAIAIDRDGTGLLRFYVNGVVQGTASIPAMFTATATMMIANEADSPTQGFSGNFLDEIRITKGVARYAGNYTPATAAFPNGSGGLGCGGFHSPFSQRISFPSPTLLAALAPLALGRAIERNRVSTRRRLLSLRP